MDNPFLQVGKNSNKISLQEEVDGEISVKKAGRPRKPNMGRYHIRLPKSLHAKVTEHCNENGYSISTFIQYAVLDKLDN